MKREIENYAIKILILIDAKVNVIDTEITRERT